MRIRTAAVLLGGLAAFLGTVAAGYVAAELNQPAVAPDRASTTWLLSAMLAGWVTILPVYVAVLALAALLVGRRRGAAFLYGAVGLFVGVLASVSYPVFGNDTVWVVAVPLAIDGVVSGRLVGRFGMKNGDIGPTPELEAAYAEPHRRYHTAAHIRDCLQQLRDVPDLGQAERSTLQHAIWWHDAIYDPTRSDNEEVSAQLAERDLAAQGVPEAERVEVARLIRLTKGHTVEPGDRLGAILVSIDLSILGRPPADYDAYAAAIRQEYAHVPDDLYRAGRAAVLRHFLDTPAIYPDPAFRERYEAQARANLARELAALQGRPSPLIAGGA